MNHLGYKTFIGRHKAKGGSLQVNPGTKLDHKLFETQPYDPAKNYETTVFNANKDYTWASAGGGINHVDFTFNKYKGRKTGNAKLKLT
jgi:hypothetical protein